MQRQNVQLNGVNAIKRAGWRDDLDGPGVISDVSKLKMARSIFHIIFLGALSL